MINMGNRRENEIFSNTQYEKKKTILKKLQIKVVLYDISIAPNNIFKKNCSIAFKIFCLQ